MAPLNRHHCLEALDSEQLATWLSLAPVVERLAFAAPKSDARTARLMGIAKPRPAQDIEELASIVDSGTGVLSIIRGLDAVAYKLLVQAVWQGGSLRRSDTTDSFAWPKNAITAARMEPEIDAAADRLRFLLLAEKSLPSVASASPMEGDAPWLEIVGDVKAIVSLPGLALRDGIAAETSDELAARLRSNGMKDIPSRREDREKMLLGLVRDPEHIGAIVDALSPEARIMLGKLVGHLRVMGFYELGVRGNATFDRRYRPVAQAASGAQLAAGPLLELHDLGLIGAESYEERVWVWREVAQILRTELYDSRELVAAPVPISIDAGRSFAAGPLANLERLFDLWKTAPPSALADGGLGVAPVRSAAKKLKIAAGHLGLLAHLAIGLGLLRSRVIGTEGRGRNLRHVYGWETTESLAEWLHRPASERWAMLVHLWLTDESLLDIDALPERWQPGFVTESEPLARHLVLRVLEGLDRGFGASVDDTVMWASQQWRLLLWPSQVAAVIEGARALGLVPGEGGVGLTNSARALLDGRLEGTEIGGHSPTGAVGTIVVQGDYTVIVAPDVDLDIRLFVDRVATLESDAGARVYRLTEASLTAAMAAGLSAPDINRGLAERSRTMVPQSVSYLIADVERKRKLIVLASAVTVIASSDAALIAAAVRVKSAKLRELGPFTAVSLLPAAKVRVALAAKGVHVTVEQAAETSPMIIHKPAAPKLPTVAQSPYVGISRIRSEAAGLSNKTKKKLT